MTTQAYTDGTPVGGEKHILVDFDGERDPYDPHNFSSIRKCLIILLVIAASFSVATTSSIYTTIYDQIIPEFSTSFEVATLGLSLYVVGLGLGPLTLAPLSEFYGRRPIYIVSYFFFFIWQIPCAFAKNIATLLIARFLAGYSGSAFLSVSGGSVSDLFIGEKQRLPMALFATAPFLGPVFGPLIGGYICQYTTWRWTFRVTTIWTFVLWVLLITVPETYRPAVLKQKARALRKTKGDRYRAPIEIMDKSLPQTLLTNLRRPFILFAEPIVFLLNTWTSILLAILYLSFAAFPIVFEGEHGFTLSQAGLTFLGLGIGEIFAVVSIPLLMKVQRRLRERDGDSPEILLIPAMVGAIIGPIGLFWFASTTNTFWIVPILAGIPFGAAILLTFTSVFSFLVRAYQPWAASAMASNSVERSILAAAFPLFARQMYQNVGDRWASAILAFLLLAMTPLPFVFYKYGARIRENSQITQLMYPFKG